MARPKLESLLGRHFTPVALGVLVVAVTLIGEAGSAVLNTMLVNMLINLMLVIGLYVFAGNSGVFSFGHIGFMAVGAYTTAAFRIPEETKNVLFPGLPGTELGSIAATLVGGAMATVVALVVALPLMRLSGLVASLGTFAFLNIVFVVTSNLDEVTGGSTGLGGVPTTTTRTTALVWALLAIAVAWAYQQTASCLRVRGSREDEAAARAIGIGITGERTVSFCLSAFITGVAGGLFAQFLGTFNPNTFFITLTFATVAMLVVGGRLSLSGAVIGALFISWVSEGVRRVEDGADFGLFHVGSLPGLQQVVIAVVMLLTLIVRPRGLTNSEEITPASLRALGAGIGRLPARVLSLRKWRPRPRRPVQTPDARANGDDAGKLVVDDLAVQYGRIVALRGLSLEVTEGEIVALVGPNGAGKSTTLAAIAGFLAPTRGSITYGGRSLLGQPPERIVRHGIALVPEGRQILGTLSVAENLQLGTTPLRDRSTIPQDLDEIFALFPILRTYYDSSAAKLSGGEQQQLAIARALLSKPRLLLLDEPSLGLAPLMVDVVFDVLERLRDAGTTILLVEQNAAAAIDLADRAYVLQTGQIVSAGSREEILAETDLAATYLGMR